VASICSIDCSWLLRRSRACFQSKISFLIRKCAHLAASAHISLHVKPLWFWRRIRPAVKGVRRNISSGGAKSTFCLSFSGCWRCNANWRVQKRKFPICPMKISHMSNENFPYVQCNSCIQCFPCKKTLQWTNVCFSEHGFFKTELAEFWVNYQLCEFLECAKYYEYTNKLHI